jgi:hypothetical protein
MNRITVESADQAVELSGKIKGPRVMLRVWSRGASHYVSVETHKKNTTK